MDLVLIERLSAWRSDVAGAAAADGRSRNRFRRLFDLLGHPTRHSRMVGAVAAPVFRGIRQRQPQLTRKYMNPEHLVLGWTPVQRVDAMVHHYRFMEAHLAPACLALLLDRGVAVWQAKQAAGSCELSLRFSHPTDNEGELSLTYTSRNVPIYIMSFSFVPGPLVGSSAETVILITRIQGSRTQFELIREGMKAMKGLAAPAMFMAAIGGLAESLGLTAVVGTRAEVQVCHDKTGATYLGNVYDDFFLSIGGVRSGDFFHIPLPLAVKPISLVKSSNRSRVLAQRKIKQQVTNAALDALELRADHATDPARQLSRSRERTLAAKSTKTAVTLVFLGAFSEELDGAQARVASLLDRLVVQFDHVLVYSHANEYTFPWTDRNRAAFARRWPNVELITEDFPKLLGRVAALKNLAISVAPRLTERALGLRIPGLTPKFEAVRERTGVFFVNYKHALTMMNGIDGSRCVVETHDILSLKASKLSGVSPISANILRKLRGEMAALNATRAVVAISPAEASFFRMMLPDAAAFYVSSYTERAIDSVRATSADYDLVFVASDYVMNVRGFIAMVERHAGWLSRYRIAVCGLVCRDADMIALAARLPAIQLLGFVPDLDALYARCKLALAPVDGTGLKMKILSALEHGVPSLASQQALEGLPPGYQDAIFPIEEATALRLLDDDAALATARQEALRYYARFNAAGEVKEVLAMIETMKSEMV